MKSITLALFLCATTAAWAVPPTKTAPAAPAQVTAASATAPWHLGVYYEHGHDRGQGLNGVGVRLGRDLFSHFGLEANLAGSVRNGLTFAYVGSANQTVFQPGSLDRFSANLLGDAFEDWGPLRLTIEAGPALEHFDYQGVSAATHGAFYYGAGAAVHSQGGWGVRVQFGEDVFEPVSGAGHVHLWSISIGPSFRW